jgi:hypothetical protein
MSVVSDPGVTAPGKATIDIVQVTCYLSINAV